MSTTSAELANKRWLESMQSGATAQKYKDGINAVTENPMQKAADAEALWLERIAESARTGKRRASLAGKGMDLWRGPAISKGAARLADGARTAGPKQLAAAQKWAPIWAQASEAVKNMAKGTRAAAKERVGRVIDIMMDAAGRTS